jgi:hypothetical protein
VVCCVPYGVLLRTVKYWCPGRVGWRGGGRLVVHINSV